MRPPNGGSSSFVGSNVPMMNESMEKMIHVLQVKINF